MGSCVSLQSAIRALDAITELVAEKRPGHDVQRFIVGGGSKVDQSLLFSSFSRSFMQSVTYSKRRRPSGLLIAHLVM